MPKVKHIRPEEIEPGTFSDFERIVLAQGDSWFSIGAIPPMSTSNLIMNMDLTRKVCVVNCAQPGATLLNMVDWMEGDAFGGMLSGRRATTWNGIFLSAGGNDLINAIQTLPTGPDGQPVPQTRRLLLTPQEVGPAPASAAAHLSDTGWQTFSDYLFHNFDTFVSRRELDYNKGVPTFFHSYDFLLARDAGAFPGVGPWLYKAVTAYSVPPAMWSALGVELITRLAALLGDIIKRINSKYGRDMNLHLVDSKGTLTAAVAGSTGTSNDWQNEIHPTSDGYRKLDVVWKKVVDPVW